MRATDKPFDWRVCLMGAGCAERFMSGSARGCVKKTRKRPAVRKMEVGPPEPSCRRRLQTAVSCFSQKLRW